jgi:signal transduction histidine kinase
VRARTRLTLLYLGLLLLFGVGLLALTIGVTSHATSISVSASPTPGGTGVHIAPGFPQSTPPANLVQHLVLAQHAADVSRLRAVSLIALALMALLATAVAWFAAGRVLRPLRSITATARTISAGNLHERLALDGPRDEIKQLGDTLDDLLGRLEASFEAQRRFVANASHELRTPLTVERTVLQVALADPNATVETLRAACQELLATGREQEQMLEALLTLASSERGLEHREPVDLVATVERVVLSFRPDIDRLGLELTSTLQPASTTGDPALVERLVANLIDNAVNHNVTGGTIEVRTGSEDGTMLLSVTNSGPLIPPSEVDRLFEPFERLDPRRSADTRGHQGLGLSIVRAIAAAHEAPVVARALREGGLTVTVSFPAP